MSFEAAALYELFFLKIKKKIYSHSQTFEFFFFSFGIYDTVYKRLLPLDVQSREQAN